MIQIWRSTDLGAPAITGQQGKLGDALQEILVRGYPRQSVTGITRTGTTATATVTAHGYRDGQVASISGANEADYNGNFTVTNCTTNTFDYTVANAPATPATGTILAGGEKTIGTVTSLTRVSQTVTVNLTAHGLSTGNRTRISGANEAQYNGVWPVASVVDANNFTYTLPAASAPDTPATGTIVARYGVEGAGWTMPYSATNKRLFRQAVSGAKSRHIVRINETDATYHTRGAGIIMCEDATAVDTLTNTYYATEGANFGGMFKSATADATVTPWVAIGDGRTLLLLNKPGAMASMDADGWYPLYLGDIESYVPNDAYPQLSMLIYRNSGYYFNNINAYSSYTPNRSYNGSCGFADYLYMSGTEATDAATRMGRNHLGQVGSMFGQTLCAQSSCITDNSSRLTVSTLGNYTQATMYDAYPDPVHGGINMAKIQMIHKTTSPATGNFVIRGALRGMWNPLHRRIAGWNNNDTFSGSGDTAGKTFEAFNLGYGSGWVLVETSDTWAAA